MTKAKTKASKISKISVEAAIKSFRDSLDRVPNNNLSEDEVNSIVQKALDETRIEHKKQKS